MRTILATLAAFALFAADEAPAPKLDRIILTNGRALAGTIESEADDHYMIKLAAGGGGALLIKKDRVESVVRGVEDMPKPTIAKAEAPAGSTELVTGEERKNNDESTGKKTSPDKNWTESEHPPAGLSLKEGVAWIKKLSGRSNTGGNIISFAKVVEVLGPNFVKKNNIEDGLGISNRYSFYEWSGIGGERVTVKIRLSDNVFAGAFVLNNPNVEIQKRR